MSGHWFLVEPGHGSRSPPGYPFVEQVSPPPGSLEPEPLSCWPETFSGSCCESRLALPGADCVLVPPLQQAGCDWQLLSPHWLLSTSGAGTGPPRVGALGRQAQGPRACCRRSPGALGAGWAQGEGDHGGPVRQVARGRHMRGSGLRRETPRWAGEPRAPSDPRPSWFTQDRGSKTDPAGGRTRPA